MEMVGRRAGLGHRRAVSLALLAVAIGEPARAGNASASVAVSARVLPRTVGSVESSETRLLITAADLQRGYLDVSLATRLRVTSNEPNGYLLVFDFSPDVIRSIIVRGLGTDAKVSASGGWIPQPYTGPETKAFDLSYRLLLAGNASAGSYSWPVSVSVNPR